ncbi:MAG: aspartyl-phosphate phosphatase Spo0E family protein [Clostridia bacterium]|nr:aspartyl-phosphate phosphatase Spo0E family protein [Clostridia bacterium]
MIYKDIEKQLEELRKKLHSEIEKSGIDATKTLKISEQLDELIKKYYTKIYYTKKNTSIQNNVMYMEYTIAYNQIKEITKKTGKFPSIKDWNIIAKKDTYLNNKSIEYICRVKLE